MLRSVPAGIIDPVEISDLYLRGTELRLRRMESSRELIWKLGQKVRVHIESPETVNMTNIYLAEHEYDLLASLEGAPLRKTRWHWVWADRRLSVDVFHAELAGLILAEVELEPDEPLLGLPSDALVDVTRDDRFSGGALAWLAEGVPAGWWRRSRGTRAGANDAAGLRRGASRRPDRGNVGAVAHGPAGTAVPDIVARRDRACGDHDDRR